MHNEAEAIFIAVGKRLQKRRLVDDGTMIHSYLKVAFKNFIEISLNICTGC